MVYVTGENIIQKQKFVGDTKVMLNCFLQFYTNIVVLISMLYFRTWHSIYVINGK